MMDLKKMYYCVPGFNKDNLKFEVIGKRVYVSGKSEITETDLQFHVYVGNVSELKIDVKDGIMIIEPIYKNSDVTITIS